MALCQINIPEPFLLPSLYVFIHEFYVYCGKKQSQELFGLAKHRD